MERKRGLGISKSSFAVGSGCRETEREIMGKQKKRVAKCAGKVYNRGENKDKEAPK